jgi:hypothetical protein
VRWLPWLLATCLCNVFAVVEVGIEVQQWVVPYTQRRFPVEVFSRFALVHGERGFVADECLPNRSVVRCPDTAYIRCMRRPSIGPRKVEVGKRSSGPLKPLQRKLMAGFWILLVISPAGYWLVLVIFTGIARRQRLCLNDCICVGWFKFDSR